MWKSIFIESCILSALIFGGLYLNTAYLKTEISNTQDQINQQTEKEGFADISGRSLELKASMLSDHVSGNNLTRTPSSHISGVQQTFPAPTPSKVSPQTPK
jgi:hypothetical protein